LFDAHECAAHTCLRPFPPLLVESCLQRYGQAASNAGADSHERSAAALQLGELFLAQIAQMLLSARFLAGRDLLAPALLHDIDEWMRSAVVRGEAKGRRAAEETLGRSLPDNDFDGASAAATSPHPSPRGTDDQRPDAPERAATMALSHSSAASASHAAPAQPYHAQHHSTAASDSAYDARSRLMRRGSQDSSLIHHPFAPEAYDGGSGEGSSTARIISGAGGYGASGGGGGRGRRAHAQAASALHHAQPRPRQCVLSCVLGLLRFANGLAARLKYWRGQIKAKQQQIATLTAMATAAPPKAAESSVDPKRIEQLQRQLADSDARVESLESQLASATAALHEYESSGRVRAAYEPRIGDTHIDFGAQANQGALLMQLDAARRSAETSRTELAEREQVCSTLQEQLSSNREEASSLRSKCRAREADLSAAQQQVEERSARVAQLESMLEAIKTRVGTREAEWEAREQSWREKHQGASCGPTTTSSSSTTSTLTNGAAADDTATVEAFRAELEAERARFSAARRAQESEWFSSQSARDKREAELQAAARHAKTAHAAALREFEDLRRESAAAAQKADEERREAEQRQRKANQALTEARATIATLRAQIKRLQESGGGAPPNTTAAAAPSVPAATEQVKGPSKEDALAARQAQQARRREAAEEARRASEVAMARAEQEEAEERAEHERRTREAEVAAQAAAERIRAAAAARAKKEKQAKKQAAADAAAAAAEAAAKEQAVAAAAAAAAEEKARRKAAKRESRAAAQGAGGPPPASQMLAPPTAAELEIPTPKLSSGYGRCVYEPGEWYEVRKIFIAWRGVSVLAVLFWFVHLCNPTVLIF
jgi:hypothetical protein